MMRIVHLVLASLLVANPAIAQPNGALPADLGAVPADAVLFAHVRAAELWRTEPFKEIRALVDRAGPNALATYNRRFPISPALVDRVTLFAIAGRPEPAPLVVVSLREPTDQTKLVAFLLPQAKPETVGNATVYTSGENRVCMYVIDQKTFVMSDARALKAYLSWPKAANGNLSAAKSRALTHHLTVAVNVGALPREAALGIPPELAPLAAADLAGLALDVGTEIKIEAGLRYQDSESAIAAEKAARDGIAMARRKLQEARKEIGKPLLEPTTPAPAPIRELPTALESLGGLAMFGVYDDLLEKVPLAREGSNLVVRTTLPSHAAPTLPLVAMGAAAYFGFAARAVVPPPPVHSVPAPIPQPVLPDKP